MIEGVEDFKDKLKQHETRSRKLQYRNEQLTARRKECEDKKKEFSRKMENIDSEWEKFAKSRLSSIENSYSDEIGILEDKIKKEMDAYNEASQRGIMRNRDNFNKMLSKKEELVMYVKQQQSNATEYNEKASRLKKEFKALLKAEFEEIKNEWKAICDEGKQIEIEHSAILLEKKQLAMEEKLLFPEAQLKLQDTLIEQAPESNPLGILPSTFLTQSVQKRVTQVKQTGVSLSDVKHFLAEAENVDKLNRDLERKFVNLDKSLKGATADHIELELDGKGAQKVSVHLKAEEHAGEGVITYSIDKASKDDFESLRSICRLAIFSAEARNRPGTFTVNESHPHKDKIKEYLRSALQEVGSRNPDLASQLIVNGCPFEGPPQRKSKRFGS